MTASEELTSLASLSSALITALPTATKLDVSLARMLGQVIGARCGEIDALPEDPPPKPLAHRGGSFLFKSPRDVFRARRH